MNYKQEQTLNKQIAEAHQKAMKVGLQLWYYTSTPDHLYLSKTDDAFYNANHIPIAQGKLSDLLPIIDRYWNLKVFS